MALLAIILILTGVPDIAVGMMVIGWIGGWSARGLYRVQHDKLTRQGDRAV
jgi:hypothetical protein